MKFLIGAFNFTAALFVIVLAGIVAGPPMICGFFSGFIYGCFMIGFSSGRDIAERSDNLRRASLNRKDFPLQSHADHELN